MSTPHPVCPIARTLWRCVICGGFAFGALLLMMFMVWSYEYQGTIRWWLLVLGLVAVVLGVGALDAWLRLP